MTATTRPQDHDQTPANGGRALSAPVVAALEATWTAIQHRHSDLPDVVLVLASGTVGMPRGAVRLGHFAAMRWDYAGDRLPEIFVAGEGLALGALDVLATLLHEATHALAHVRGIQDTSRQGRYHNRRFQALAAELGLDVHEVPVIGYSKTLLPAATATEYATELKALADALTIHRYAEHAPQTTSNGGNGSDGTRTGEDDDDSEPPVKKSDVARCACNRRIRVAPSVLAVAPITCSACGNPFTPTP
jgi:hypothetical protein